jgi:PPP family 3-phenylpropionic acid transporter
LVLFTIFRSPVTALVDVLALDAAARAGGDFGRLRAWGTAGFLVGMLAAGPCVDRFGSQAIVHFGAVLLALTLVATAWLPRAAAPARIELLPALSLLARRPRFLRFIATASLHQVGLASYDVLFGAHLTRLSSATYASLAIAFGAAAEVVMMTWGRRWLRALGLGRTLVIAYGVSAVRWVLIATVHEPRALILIQALHALTFGAFYLAGVALVDEESPPEVRASAQGIFGAITWGLASALALTLAGWLQREGGIRLVFCVAAAVSVASMVLAGGLTSPTHVHGGTRNPLP